MPRVFLSFRKVDSRWMRDRVYRVLVDRFGANEIFKAGESIPPGAGFAEILRRQAAECDVMLVLIGPRWLDAAGPGGIRLLDRADDWVRVEVATALRAGNRVVPVLLGDAVMLPEASALPAEIAELAGLQFLRIPDTHSADALGRLTAALAALLPGLQQGSPPSAVDTPASREASVTMTAHVTGGGSAYQAGRDQRIGNT